MTAVSITALSDAFPHAGSLRNALREAKFAALAAQLHKSESWPSKVANGECGVLLDDIEPLLDALGLRIIPSGSCVVDADIFNSLLTIAAAALVAPEKLRPEA